MPGPFPRNFENFCKANGLPGFAGKIFEITGTKGGQEIGLPFWVFTGKLIHGRFSPWPKPNMPWAGSWPLMLKYRHLGLFAGRLPHRSGIWCCPKRSISVLCGNPAHEHYSRDFRQVHKAGSPAKRIVLTPDF